MKKHTFIKKSYLLVAIISIILVLIFLYYNQEKYKNKYEENQSISENFFFQNLFHEGAIATNPGNLEYVEEYATGNQVLSESQGLWMQYCLLKDDQVNFDKALNFVKNKMLIENFISYRYVTDGELFYVTSAIDDFRIVGALIEADKKWGNKEYLESAIIYSESMYESIIQNDNIVDFYDIAQESKGNALTLCYADFNTMNWLINIDSRWQPIFDNSLKIIKEGYLGDSFPCFATSFDYASSTYNTKQINMVQSLITAINLASIDQCPEQTVEFIENKVKTKTLFGSYLSTGEPVDNVNSTAVYALAAILGNKTGNKELETEALDVMIQFQVLNEKSELYGGFADENTKDAFSFDNLNGLIAMQMKSNEN